MTVKVYLVVIPTEEGDILKAPPKLTWRAADELAATIPGAITRKVVATK